MKCPRCERPAEAGQRFCNGCGLRLTGDDGSTLLTGDAPESAPASSSAPASAVAPRANPSPPVATSGHTGSHPIVQAPNNADTVEPDLGAVEPSTAASATASAQNLTSATSNPPAPADPTPPSIQPAITPGDTDQPDGPDERPATKQAPDLVGEAANQPTLSRVVAPDSSTTVHPATPRNPVSTTPAAHRPARSAQAPVQPLTVSPSTVNPTPEPSAPTQTSTMPATTATAMPAQTSNAQARSAARASANPPGGSMPTGVLPVTAVTSRSAWRKFRFNTTTVLGLVIGVVSVVSIFINILTVKTNPPVVLRDELPFAFRMGDWVMGQVGSNLPIAVLIIALLAILGALVNGFGARWGGGLVGGASLSMTGVAALTLGLIQIPIDAARQFATIETETAFTVIITRDIGYYLLIALAGLGVVAGFASLNECFSDRVRDLNPWIAAVGALSVVAMVGGVTIPLGQAIFSDNWFVIPGIGEGPAALVAARLVQLSLILITGIIGFLLVRPYGLGLAIGGTLPSIWLGFSTLIQPDNAIGPGWRNPGAADTELHGLTIIGLAATASSLLLACLAAYNQHALRINQGASK